MRILIRLICSLVSCTILTAAEVSKDAVPPQRFVIGVSPFLEKGVKDEVYRCLVRLLVQDLPLNSRVSIYDAFELKTITQVTLPNARVFQSPKTRANQYASAIREIKQFLAAERPPPTNSHHLVFNSALRLPQFMDFLDESLTESNSPLSVLLIGSPLYQDAKEPSFSMIDGYFPSDGHLQASREKTIFGFDGESGKGGSASVHWMYFGDPWVSDLHKEKVTRFWSLYLERRAAQLTAFTGDLPTAVQGFCNRIENSNLSTRHWGLDTAHTKIEMLRVGRDVETADWLTRDTLPIGEQTPPTRMLGPMKIGIRWKENIDLDLYSTPKSGAETLFFQHVRSPEGYYYKDHRSSPGKEYEFIEFDTPVDIREVEAFINFYKGDCHGGPHGEIRIEFDGRIYSAPFSIPAEEGNLGRTGHAQQAFWTRIPVQEMLKLPQAINRAG